MFDRTPYRCHYCGKICTGNIAFTKHYEACENRIRKRCSKCEHYWHAPDGTPQNCSYGLVDGAAAITADCPKKN